MISARVHTVMALFLHTLQASEWCVGACHIYNVCMYRIYNTICCEMCFYICFKTISRQKWFVLNILLVFYMCYATIQLSLVTMHHFYSTNEFSLNDSYVMRLLYISSGVKSDILQNETLFLWSFQNQFLHNIVDWVTYMSVAKHTYMFLVKVFSIENDCRLYLSK